MTILRQKLLTTAAAAGACLLTTAGCHNLSSGGSGGSGSTASADASASARTAPAALPPNTLALKQGRAPFNYLVTQGGPVIVRDTSDGSVLATGPVAPNTVIRVDPAAGIFFGARNVKPGPLTPNHRFQILLDQSQSP